VTDAAMSVLGDGFYSYDFTGYDETMNYVMRADGTTALADVDRYKTNANNNQVIEERNGKMVKILGNRLKTTTGYQMVIYEDDGITPYLTYDLKNILGNPAYIDVTERITS
jgi:hypothetical protein